MTAPEPTPTAEHRDAIARLVWATSRADESTISAIGAQAVTHAILTSTDTAAFQMGNGGAGSGSSGTSIERTPCVLHGTAGEVEAVGAALTKDWVGAMCTHPVS